jgi:hypothetical protein
MERPRKQRTVSEKTRRVMDVRVTQADIVSFNSFYQSYDPQSHSEDFRLKVNLEEESDDGSQQYYGYIDTITRTTKVVPGCAVVTFDCSKARFLSAEGGVAVAGPNKHIRGIENSLTVGTRLRIKATENPGSKKLSRIIILEVGGSNE